MPELWEACNVKSQAILRYLYKQDNGAEPDFWRILKGKKKRQDIIIAPDYKEEEEILIDKEIRMKPRRMKRID